ncbi:MAG: isoprenylcysteine carboxylmethyltransferase family protein, partial [Gammaproteobacteria bacterium]|nr:isoprenylcysteine carboxylmethyltransferase family protein [Gammaproteobacteria bacterium]
MTFLEKRIPPPLVGILVGVAAWLVARQFAPTTLPAAPRLAVAAGFFVLGLWLAGTAARTFSRAKTTLNPIKPEASTSLVTHGIFAR